MNLSASLFVAGWIYGHQKVGPLATPRDELGKGEACDMSLGTQYNSWSSFRVAYPLQATKHGYRPAFSFLLFTRGPRESAVRLASEISWVWSLSCLTTSIPRMRLFPLFSVRRVPPSLLHVASQPIIIYSYTSDQIGSHLVFSFTTALVIGKASSCAAWKLSTASTHSSCHLANGSHDTPSALVCPDAWLYSMSYLWPDRNSAYRGSLAAVSAEITFWGLKMDRNAGWSVTSVKLLLYTIEMCWISWLPGYSQCLFVNVWIVLICTIQCPWYKWRRSLWSIW